MLGIALFSHRQDMLGVTARLFLSRTRNGGVCSMCVTYAQDTAYFLTFGINDAPMYDRGQAKRVRVKDKQGSLGMYT